MLACVLYFFVVPLKGRTARAGRPWVSLTLASARVDSTGPGAQAADSATPNVLPQPSLQEPHRAHALLSAHPRCALGLLAKVCSSGSTPAESRPPHIPALIWHSFIPALTVCHVLCRFQRDLIVCHDPCPNGISFRDVYGCTVRDGLPEARGAMWTTVAVHGLM